MRLSLDLSTTTDFIGQLHRQHLAAPGGPVPRASSLRDYSPGLREQAARQWAARALAAQEHAAHMARLLDMALWDISPMELVGAVSLFVGRATRRLAVMAQTAVELGARPAGPAPVLSDEVLPGDGTSGRLRLSRAMLLHGALNPALSAPVFDALATITDCEAMERLCSWLADDAREAADFGWEALGWLSGRWSERERESLAEGLPRNLGQMELAARASASVLDTLAGQEIVVEREQANPGLLTDAQLAAIFYHTLTEDVFRHLRDLGFSPMEAWQKHYRLGPADQAAQRPALLAIGQDI